MSDRTVDDLRQKQALPLEVKILLTRERVRQWILEGQMDLSDYGLAENQKRYKTTGCKRTGCMLCGFGCHLEKPGEGRFERLRETHPKMYQALDLIKNNGVTFR